MPKTGLKVTTVSKNHFSSNVKTDEPNFSRLVVRLIEGKRLLASDIETGKSDPVGFVWIGPGDETPNWEDADNPDSGIFKSIVCPTTIDPIWKQDIIFPLDISDIQAQANMKCLIFVKDEDIDEEGVQSYDDLGMVEIPLKDLLLNGKVLKNAITGNATWYELTKCGKMRRVDGSIKVKLTLILSSEDEETIISQLENISIDVPSLSSGTTVERLQKTLKFLNPSLPKDIGGTRSRSNSPNKNRPSSASSTQSLLSSRRKSQTQATNHIMPLVKRPQTAPINRSKLSLNELDSEIDEGEIGNDQGSEPELEIIKEGSLENASGFGLDDGSKMGFSRGNEENEDIDNNEENGLKNNKNPENKEIKTDDKEHDNFEHTPENGDECLMTELATIAVDTIGGLDMTDHTLEALGEFTKAMKKVAKQKSQDLRLKVANSDNNWVGESLSSKMSQVFKGIDRLSSTAPISGSKKNSADDLLGFGPTQGDNADISVLDQKPEHGSPEETPENNFQNKAEEKSESKVENPPLEEHKPVPNTENNKNPEKVNIPPEIPQLLLNKEPSVKDLKPSESPKTPGEKGLNTEVPQGIAAAVVRALREMKELQRQSFEDNDRFQKDTIQQMASVTHSGFKTLTARIEMLETLLSKIQKTNQNQIKPLQTRTDSSKSLKSQDSSKSQTKKQPTNKPKPSQKKVQESDDFSFIPEGDENLPEDDEIDDDGNIDDEKSASSKVNRPIKEKPVSLAEKNIEKQVKKPEKSIGVIAQAKAKARALKRIREQGKKTAANLPFTPTTIDTDSLGNNSNKKLGEKQEGFLPEIQLVYKGASGEIANATIDPGTGGREQNDGDNDKKEMPKLQRQGSSFKVPLASASADTILQSNDDFGFTPKGDQAFPTYEQNEKNKLNETAPADIFMHRQNSEKSENSKNKKQMLKDFSNVMEHGTLKDFSGLLDSYSPNPEELPVSLRNRIYDGIATLLQKNQNTERGLIWVLALTRARSEDRKDRIWDEMVGHTKKDIEDALGFIAKEPSKKGLLATLLISQI